VKIKLLAASTVLVCAALDAVVADPSAVPYPEGYPQWQHVKSMVIRPGHALYGSFGGIHHLYCDAKAMAGYSSGTFVNGAVIVFDLLEANTADNATVEGKRKVVGVMHKDAVKYAATGGWGFEGFKGDSKTERAVGANATAACFNCHLAQKETAYIFSTYRQ
jgi:hypothetical protein